MSSAILRSAALCIRANLFFKTGEYHGVEPLFDDLFGFSEMQFFGSKPEDEGGGDLLLASSPQEWFGQMQAAGIKTLRLNQEMRNHPTMHDYKMAWSVDADKAWTLVSHNPDEPAYGFWGDQSYLDQGKRVKLLGFGPQDMLNAPTTPEIAAEKLKEVLDVAIKIAEALGRADYQGVFAEAVRVIDGESQATFLMYDGAENYFELVAPKGLLPPEHINLLRAFEIYNVFAGSGSWNDVQLPEDEESRDVYHTISKALHAATVNALISVTNAGLEAEQ